MHLLFHNFHSIVLWMFQKKIFNIAKVLLPQNGFQPNIMLVHGDIAEAELCFTDPDQLSADLIRCHWRYQIKGCTLVYHIF